MDELAPAKAKGTRGIFKLIVLVVILGGLLLAGKLFGVQRYFVPLLEWVRSLGLWGPVLVAVFYVLFCVLMVPGSVITLGAGFLFGLISGTITVSIGSTLGACAAFLVGRTFARGWVEQRVVGRPKFRAIDEAVGKQGFKIVLLTRLSPVFPFNIQNYAYGLTKVKFWQYALASWLGMLPGTLMFVYFGSAARSLTEAATGQIQAGPAQRVFFWVALAATIAVVFFVTRVARKALTQAMEDSESNPQQ